MVEGRKAERGKGGVFISYKRLSGEQSVYLNQILSYTNVCTQLESIIALTLEAQILGI